MSRVHDALRKAAHEKPEEQPRPPVARATPPTLPAESLSAPEALPGLSESNGSSAAPYSAEAPAPPLPHSAALRSPAAHSPASHSPALHSPGSPPLHYADGANSVADLERLEDIIRQAPLIPFSPAQDALLVSPLRPKDAPAEEFRSLRTRLNHLQKEQPLHTLVVSSASPGEGKSFTACNLAMSQAQLADKRILLADFDFRRPSIDKVFAMKGLPGLTDYLLGKVRLADIIHRLEGTNLFIVTAGESVSNPLELLNLKECGSLLEALRDHFDWVILDSPPLLFAADGNLLATMADGTILVVRIGTTTYDSVTRALQSLCENNVIGMVVNGAHHGELYSRYSYYHSYYYGGGDSQPEPAAEESFDLEPVSSNKA